ncbi:MAG: 50S ribosomal protein L11 methyltransferase [Methyloceanibacter sp.]
MILMRRAGRLARRIVAQVGPPEVTVRAEEGLRHHAALSWQNGMMNKTVEVPLKVSPSFSLPHSRGKSVIHQTTIEAGAGTAGRIARALDEAAAPAAVAVGHFDLGNERSEVFAHYEAAPPREVLAALIAAAAEGDDIGPLRFDVVGDEDWVTLSQGKRGPVEAGGFIIHGSHDRAKVSRLRLAIEIDAARAFGTAHHASTRGCLLALDTLLKHSLPRTVLDLGTGTGILAIAAAKALGRPVWASDNDPLAVTIAVDNARMNGVGGRLRVVWAEGLAHPALGTLKPDLILTNLLERALHDLAPAIAKSVAPGGTAILSGLTQDQAPAIERRYIAFGFGPKSRIILDGWTTLVLMSRNARPLCD